MSSTQEAGEIFGAGAGPAHAMMRSPTVLIASVGLWGMNLFFFRIFGIDYVKVLKYDLLLMENDANVTTKRLKIDSSAHESTDYYSDDDDDDDSVGEAPVDTRSSITWMRLMVLSLTLLFLLHITYFYWIDVLKGGSIGAVFAFYAAVTVAIFLPLPSTRWLRNATVIALQRSFELINPRCQCLSTESSTGPRPIPFVDVFFADAMCSLSKVFFDMGMLFHMATHYPHPVPRSAHNILIPSACAAAPYIIRARQCLIMYSVGKAQSDPKRFTHLWNALKYATSVFPLCLSAYQKTIDRHRAKELEGYLILLLAINALYALYWDVVNDWGMMQNSFSVSALCMSSTGYTKDLQKPRSCWHAFLRPRLRFGIAMSALILVADTILRFSWVLRFYHKLFPSNDSFVLCTQFLEVFRRALWNLLRIEWENIKQSKAPLSGKVPEEELKVPMSGKVAIA